MIIRLAQRASILILVVSGSMTLDDAFSQDLVDPTRPLDFVKARPGVQSDLILTSVMITKKNRVAVINGELVVENQKIAGAEVISIQPGRVLLRRGDRRQELKVHQNNVKLSPGEPSPGEQSEYELKP